MHWNDLHWKTGKQNARLI